MPIAVRVVSKDQYNNFIQVGRKRPPGRLQSADGLHRGREEQETRRRDRRRQQDDDGVSDDGDRSGSRRASRPQAVLLQALVVLDQPQGHRHSLYLLRADLRLHRRDPVDLHAHGAAGAGHPDLQRPGLDHLRLRRCGRHRWRQADVQRLRHDARRPDDVPRRHSGAVRRVRQLHDADHDRRAGHGVPAHEQRFLLAAAGGAHPRPDRHVHARHGRRLWTRPGLDGLSAAIDLGRARTGDGFRDPRAAPLRRFLDPRLDQLHHHHLQHACAGHDDAQDAALRLEPSCHRLPAAAVAACSRRRHHNVADRPQLRHGVLRSGVSAATRSCSSTCSGSSATRKCTS